MTKGRCPPSNYRLFDLQFSILCTDFRSALCVLFLSILLISDVEISKILNHRSSDHFIGSSVEIKFGCFDNEYPTSICTLDTLGDIWHIEGQYQRQEMTFNDHPVCKMGGYSYLLPAVYLFLRNGNGTIDWYWTFTLDFNMTDDFWIEAKCTEGSLDNRISVCYNSLCYD